MGIPLSLWCCLASSNLSLRFASTGHGWNLELKAFIINVILKNIKPLKELIGLCLSFNREIIPYYTLNNSNLGIYLGASWGHQGAADNP
ncbi:hypothetical protein AVEN_52764-1 [Araneus ventricosus]|uniref:Uncharacterized protein n=1 Tax=Araneus ventricosus TaxID=182803 RepID=A0A4Y2CZG6_ARAVE|nr:hypothetical protein AVEN_52764-1 [Araneus ventricosus]